MILRFRKEPYPEQQLETSLQGYLGIRDRYKEIFAAAFEMETGSQEASKYELIEDYSTPNKIRWYYQKR